MEETRTVEDPTVVVKKGPEFVSGSVKTNFPSFACLAVRN